MQQSQPSAANQSYSPLVGNSSRPNPVFTHKHVSLILAGVFLLLLATATAYEVSSLTGSDTKQKAIDTQSTANVNSPDKNAVTPEVSASGTDPPPTKSQTQVSVNGQNIPVPSQGSSTRTIVSNDGHTTVNVSNSSSTQDSSQSSSSNTLNVNVNSSSSSTSGSAN